MSNKGISKALEQEVAAAFLLGGRRYDQREFSMEFGRVGLKFLRDKIDPDKQKRFTVAFDELVGLGCLQVPLASTLYCFCKSYSGSGLSFPPYAQGISFPSDKLVEKYRESLQHAFEGIKRLEDYGIMEVLARHAKCSEPPKGRKGVLNTLRWYIDALPIWWVPRKDIVQSSASMACCMYPKIATGEYRFPQVAELLECLDYRPDPKRQKRTIDRRRGEDNCYQSLERNFRNFKNSYPVFCDQLEADLKSDHEKEENRPLEEYDRWIEQGLPAETLATLRPNYFDWEIVFPHPQRKKRKS